MDLPGGAEAFRLLAESVDGYALSLLDAGGRVAFWNAGAERISGWSREDAVGRHLTFLTREGSTEREAFARALERAREGGDCHLEGWCVRRDGTPFFADLVLSAIHDGGRVAGFTHLMRDETERKREVDRQRFLAESGAVLAESLDLRESFMRVATLAVPEIADWTLVDVLVGKELERVAYAHVEPRKQKLARMLARKYPPTRDRERGVFEVVDSGRGRLRAHIAPEDLARVDWSPEHVEILRELGFRSWMCVPLSAHGRVLGAMTFVMAESERVFDESDLVFALEVGRRAGLTLENARLYSDAKRALRAREEFLAVASHELRTPLTPLRLQLDALARVVCADPEAHARQRHKIDVMRRQVDRLARLVESLLAVTRGTPIELQAGERIDLRDVVVEVVERMQERARQEETDIHVRAEAGLLGRFDPRAMEIVLEHLIDNALKYGDGAPVEVLVERAPGGARVLVQDSGIGIEEADQERIFEKFERSVSSDHYGGLGLGLFIARELVEAHGGTLAVVSERGRGAVFSVTLPLEERSRDGARDAEPRVSP